MPPRINYLGQNIDQYGPPAPVGGGSVAPTTAPVDPQQAFMAAVMKMMNERQVPSPPVDYASLFGAARNDPQGDANKGYIPGMDNQYNPFSNGFFKSAADRQAVEQSHLGTPGFSSMTPQQQSGALGTHPVPDFAGMAASASPSPFQLSPGSQQLIQQGQQKRKPPMGSPQPGFNFQQLFR